MRLKTNVDWWGQNKRVKLTCRAEREKKKNKLFKNYDGIRAIVVKFEFIHKYAF